jgi:hypothetical protein
LPSPPEVKIDEGYLDENLPIVRERLQKAGVRLAHCSTRPSAREREASEPEDSA